MHFFKKNFCELFGNAISRKTGQKCCIYGQNGKPLSKDVVSQFLDNLKANVVIDDSFCCSQKRLMRINWQANEDYTRLFRLFYFKNVFALTDFIKELYDLDYSTNLQQIPNISINNKELFKIELYTPLLKGLAKKDIQLAFAINTLKFDKFLLYPIDSEENYRSEIRQLEAELKDPDTQERTKLKNKYDALNINKGCGNPNGCPCSNS
jgi:pterin-4a-carbinolamine dehydratase